MPRLVDRLDNPAGRLHAFLSNFKSHADANKSIITCWSQALEWDEANVTVSLSHVAALVPQIEQAVYLSGDSDQVEAFEHFAPLWGAALFFPLYDGNQKPSGALELISPGSLQALGSLSGFLSATASEGLVPAPDRLADLRAQVDDLLQGVLIDAAGNRGMPAEVSALVIDHLHRLLWALDHLRLGGPGAVQAVTDRLLVQLAVAPEPTKRHGVWTKVLGVTFAVYTAFTKGPEVQAAIESWGHIIQELPRPPLG